MSWEDEVKEEYDGPIAELIRQQQQKQKKKNCFEYKDKN